MKKITLLFAILCSLSIFPATTYLVYQNGGSTWDAGVSGTQVNLSTVNAGVAVSFNAWFTDKTLATPTFSGATFVTGDQVWIMKGTYTLTGTVTLKAGVAIYGGFGTTATESVATRAKNSISAWDFTNVTILDGASTYICISGGSASIATLVDGLTIQNGKNSATASSAGGAKINGTTTTMQNCIIKNCSTLNAATGSAGGVILMGGGTVKDSYIHDNSQATASSNGGGLSIYGASCILSGCTIANNTATKGGAGLYLYSTTGGVSVSGCTFTANAANGGDGGGINSFISGGAQSAISISNCTFSSNTATGSGGAMSLTYTTTTNIFNISGCTFTSNTAACAASTTAGGGAVFTNSGVFNIDKCIFNNNSTTLSNGGAILLSAGGTSTNTISNSSFIGNTSGTTTTAAGSALYCGKSTTVNNCVVAGNTGSSAIYVYAAATTSGTFNNMTLASNVTSLAAPAGIYLSLAQLASTFTNCLLYNCGTSPIGYSTGVAPTVTYTGFGTDVTTLPTYAGTGCINTIDATSFVNPATNDYHLALGSLAINAGTTSAISGCSPDRDGVITRPQGGKSDMGAYEVPFYNSTVTFTSGGTVNTYTTGDVDSKPQGTQTAYVITPTYGYQLTSVKYNAVEQIANLTNLIDGTNTYNGGTFTASALSANSTLDITFTAVTVTGVSNASNNFNCYAANQHIELKGLKIGDEVAVYTVTGAKVASQQVNSTSASIAVSRGIYLVKVAGQVKKVVVD